MQLIFRLVIATLALYVPATEAAGERREVELSIKCDREQPCGWPVIVDLTLKNVDTAPITWWDGGPGEYPGADNFIVEIYCDGEGPWRTVEAGNGQNVEGSGVDGKLKPGDSIVVPLAIPVGSAHGVCIRISPRSWHVAKPAEISAELSAERRFLDTRQARAIGGAMAGSSPFWQWIASRYPDAVVLDVMMKLVMVDNPILAARAARVLEVQMKLPDASGEDFARLVERWLPQKPEPDGGLRESVTSAALKTQSEAARAAVLRVMNETRDKKVRWIAMNAIRVSSGDIAWFTRARSAIITLKQAQPDDVELSREADLAIEWLTAGIQNDGIGKMAR